MLQQLHNPEAFKHLGVVRAAVASLASPLGPLLLLERAPAPSLVTLSEHQQQQGKHRNLSGFKDINP